MAHGTPSSLDEMPAYLSLVRGGRRPSPELVAEMRHNYAAIGGRSPLTDLTMAQAHALRRRLGADVPVEVGMRNWKPFIVEAVAELARAGVTRVIGIPLAPQFSRLSVGKYFEAAEGAHRLGDRALIVRERGDIAGDADDLVAELGAQLGGPGRDPLHDPDAGALLEVACDDRPADPRAAARHQRHLAIEPPHDALRPVIFVSAHL